MTLVPPSWQEWLADATLHVVNDRVGYIQEGFPPMHMPFDIILGECWVSERSIPAHVRPWRPFAETIPLSPSGTPDSEVLKGTEQFFANSHYLVFVRAMESDNLEVPHGMHLSMRTVENDTRHDWREMQRVKNELAGPDWEAVELYPAESRVVDAANQYHLWCVPFRIGMGFEGRFVRDADDPFSNGARQRAHVPGVDMTDDAATNEMLESWHGR